MSQKKISAMEHTESGDGDTISTLPKEILHNVLYFLPKREAAQTCVLSKSWRQIWSTRPKLSLRQRRCHKKRVFLSHVDNVLQAHLHHNLHLEKLRLEIHCKSISLLEKWIPLLETIGVRELYLSILLNRSRRLQYVGLPPVVLTSAESLKLLYLHNCKLLDRKAFQNIPFNINRLEVLRLRNVSVAKEVFDKIIASCPMIRTMWFKECEGLKTIKLVKDHHKNLKHFTFTNDKIYREEECCIEIDEFDNVGTIKITGSKIWFHGHNYINLKSLSLKRVGISFDNSSCKFPRLGFLRLDSCYGFGQVHLRIDAPNIRCFEYIGDFIPSISFAETSRNWSSQIDLFVVGFNNARTWLLKLSKLLQAISQSEICLNIFQNPRNIVNIQDNVTVRDNKLVVLKHLQLNGRLSSFPSYLNGLFCICRPENIDQHWYTQGHTELEREQKELTEFLCKILIKKGSNGNDQEIRQDLVDVRIESFDTSRREWQSITGPNLLECSLPADKYHHRIRFGLTPLRFTS